MAVLHTGRHIKASSKWFFDEAKRAATILSKAVPPGASKAWADPRISGSMLTSAQDLTALRLSIPSHFFHEEAWTKLMQGQNLCTKCGEAGRPRKLAQRTEGLLAVPF